MNHLKIWWNDIKAAKSIVQYYFSSYIFSIEGTFYCPTFLLMSLSFSNNNRNNNHSTFSWSWQEKGLISYVNCSKIFKRAVEEVQRKGLRVIKIGKKLRNFLITSLRKEEYSLDSVDFGVWGGGNVINCY